MHLDTMLDSFYVLSVLLGGASRSPVCTAPPESMLSSVRVAPLAMRLDVPTRPRAATAFVNVNVVPMDTERVLANQTVVIQNGRITALGPTDKVLVPAGAVRIDGQGRYLIPGLGEMHVHKLIVARGTKDNPTDETDVMQAALFKSYLALGVTAVRTLEGPPIQHMEMLQRALKRTGPWPRLYLARSIWPGIRPDSVAAHVAASKAAGYSHIGTHFILMMPRSPEGRDTVLAERVVLDSLVAAARRVRLPISAHSHRFPFDAVLAVGSTGGSFEHLSSVFYDTLGIWALREARQPAELPMEKIQPLIAALKRAGVWITPTMACMERVHTSVKGMQQSLKALHDGGVGLLLGLDNVDPSEELESLVRAGLTPYQALLTGTRNVAQYFNILDSAGTVAVGKQADLVLLDGNPLVDISYSKAIAGVMIDGRWLDRAALTQNPRTP